MEFAHTVLDRTEPDFARASRQGDRDAAFGRMYHLYRERIFRLASSYARDEDDAHDITQLVFVRAHRSLDRFRGQSRIYTWLYRIAVNCCKDWIKQAHQARCDRRDDGWWSERAIDEGLHTVGERTESLVERRETVEALEEAMKDLKPEFREALVLREIEGLTYREIATTLSCSEGTVKSRICRARRHIKSVLIRAGHSV